MSADELFKDFVRVQKETNRLIDRHRRNIRQLPEYKEILQEINFLREHLRLAKSQQRLMGRKYETDVIQDAKEKQRTAWENFCKKRQEELDAYKEVTNE